MFYGTAFSLLPPLLAIILALVTKHVYLSLFAGVFLGALMIGGFSFWLTFSALYTAMTENFDTPIILFLIGFIYVAEVASVILQVGYFKLTHGKRIFKMAPIHHHFELCGMKETQIVAMFMIVTAVLCFIGIYA